MSNSNKLHALLAVENDVSTTTTSLMQEATRTFIEKRTHFDGHVEKVEYFDENRIAENTIQIKVMVSTVREKLDFVAEKVSRWIDLALSKETTNQAAKADIIVNEVTLAKDVPVTGLLFLEKKIAALRTMISAVPTLAPGKEWSPAVGEKHGVFKAPPESVVRTEKTEVPLVLADATERHPAQVKTTVRDIPVAKVTKSHTSGALSVLEKSEILERIDVIATAIKSARMAANDAEAQHVQVANRLMSYILNGTL